MSVLDMAAATRATGSGYITLSALDAFPQYLDSDGYTRCLAQRDSDGSIMVLYVRGAVLDIVGVFNARSRVTHERSQFAATAADESLTEPERNSAAAEVASRDESLKTLPRVRGQVTVHVARALTHYERASAEPEPEPS